MCASTLHLSQSHDNHMMCTWYILVFFLSLITSRLEVSILRVINPHFGKVKVCKGSMHSIHCCVLAHTNAVPTDPNLSFSFLDSSGHYSQTESDPYYRNIGNSVHPDQSDHSGLVSFREMVTINSSLGKQPLPSGHRHVIHIEIHHKPLFYSAHSLCACHSPPHISHIIITSPHVLWSSVFLVQFLTSLGGVTSTLRIGW